MENINKNIRFLREREGWTQQELADKLGVKKSMVGAYEEFRVVPRLPTSVKIADLFMIDLNLLIREDLSKKVAKSLGKRSN